MDYAGVSDGEFGEGGGILTQFGQANEDVVTVFGEATHKTFEAMDDVVLAGGRIEADKFTSCGKEHVELPVKYPGGMGHF